jgi:hypothetical protein
MLQIFSVITCLTSGILFDTKYHNTATAFAVITGVALFWMALCYLNNEKFDGTPKN